MFGPGRRMNFWSIVSRQREAAPRVGGDARVPTFDWEGLRDP
jgi:hypothetical protein